MKKIFSIIVISILIIGIFTGCAATSSLGNRTQSLGNSNGSGNVNNSGNAINTSVKLSENEIQGLLYMVEEEKLARDVYTYLYDKWGTQTLGNIINSEQTHMDAVRKLLSAYGIDNPTLSEDYGVFENQDLQSLYDSLIRIGSESEADAVKVGALIEEVDIIDLEKRVSETKNDNIIIVYQNLNDGSENHLRAFVSKLSVLGVEYAPQYLSQQEYDAIVGLNSTFNKSNTKTDTVAHSTQKGGQNGGN